MLFIIKKIELICIIASIFVLCSGFTTGEDFSPEIIGYEYETEDVEVCSSSDVKTYMSYKAITNKKSKQYKFIESEMVVNEDSGMLLDEHGFTGVALGSYFGDIGSRFVFTLSTGIELKLVKVEAKADVHVNNGCEHKKDKSVIEFVIDKDIAKGFNGETSNNYVLSGNFNNSESYEGEIEKIEKVINITEVEIDPIIKVNEDACSLISQAQYSVN